MSFFEGLKKYQAMSRAREKAERKTAELENKNKILEDLKLQMSQNILELTEEEKRFKGNEYNSYDKAILEIEKKYNGTAQWGVLQTGNIIDLRGVFIMADGLRIMPKNEKKEPAENEMNFCDAFMRYNNLDEEVPAEFAKEAEIEGRILLKLFWDEKSNMVAVRYKSWTTTKYTIKSDPQDYLKYIEASWKNFKTQKEENIDEPDFVYKKFGGRVSDPNTAAPRIMKCLTQIESLDKALRDLREINRLFSAPILEIELENGTDIVQAKEDIEKLNWKIGKMLPHTGKLGYVQPTMTGVDALEKEIITLAKMISGTTGTPVHFLGLPDLLSNRATADNLMQLIFGSTLKERKTWKGAFEEVISKAMAIYNKQNKIDQKTNKLDPTKIKVDIPFISEEHWLHLEKVLLPAVLAGKISDELFLSLIPGIDAKEEMKRREEKDKSELTNTKAELDSIKAEKLQKEMETI